jgi:hypothetical protein
VGTPEQVADALLDYYDLGVRNFLIRGFDPLNDAAAVGVPPSAAAPSRRAQDGSRCALRHRTPRGFFPSFLIRGFDPLNDAADYGRALLPIAREKAARRAVADHLLAYRRQLLRPVVALRMDHDARSATARRAAFSPPAATFPGAISTTCARGAG